MPTAGLNMFIFFASLATLFNPRVAFPQEIKKGHPRIQVYEEAPDFTLEDISGKEVKLSDYRGGKKVVLVFYRGWVGYW